MTLLLAQSTPDAVTLAAVIGVLVFLLAGVNQAWTFAKNVRGKGVAVEQPVEIRFAAQFAARDDLNKLEEHNKREHDNLFSRLGGMERGIRTEIKSDVDKLYDQINQLRVSVAGLNTASNMQDDHLHRIEKKLDDALAATHHAPRTTNPG